MRTLLNITRSLFGGVWLWLGYMFFGVITCTFTVTVPAGIAPSRIASYVLWPLGKRVVDIPNAGTGSVLVNIAWLLVTGLWPVLGYAMTALAQLIMIIGTPVATTNIKMIPITCFPSGKMVVTDPRAIT